MHTTDTTTETETSNRATYCPEDNKLRLYVGRVPRDEYEALRADGWTSTPKQDCDFAATWTPSRRDTCLDYAGIIEDEDQGPGDRAADRAERFAAYRSARTVEAGGHADRFDAGPIAHGYQSAVRATRAANRHDRTAARAVDAWSKAEYWQQRTAGVISHALHVSAPGVRMGRIKTLEAELRQQRSYLDTNAARWNLWTRIAAMENASEQTAAATRLADHSSATFNHPFRPGTVARLWSMLQDPEYPITGAQAAALWLSHNAQPPTENEWTIHLSNRLAYENQMLAAQGGRAAALDIVPGGKLGGRLIHKVNKSNVTGRVVSVWVKGSRVQGWTYRAKNVPGTDYALHQFDTERMAPSAYTAPTPESLAELAADQAAAKAGKPEKAPCPLINPTDADAARLQDLINARDRIAHGRRSIGEYIPADVHRMTQAEYSARTGSDYSPCATEAIGRSGNTKSTGNLWSAARAELDRRMGPALCKIRMWNGGGKSRVIIITDKPQKALPSGVWEPLLPANAPEMEAAR